MDESIAMLFTNRATVIEAQRVVERLGLKIKIRFSDHAGARSAAEQLVEEGARIIISRGGVANLLRGFLTIPVVAVEYRYGDFAQAIENASKISKKIAIVSFNQGIHAALRVEQYLGQGLKLIQIDDFSRFDQTMLQLCEEGIEVVIGGHSAQTFARKHGLQSVPIMTDPHAIETAIEEARHTLTALYQYESKMQTILAIINCAPCGIISINREGRITNLNTIAQEILGLGAQPVDGMHYNTVLPFPEIIESALAGRSFFRRVAEYRENFLAVNCVPVLVDGTAEGAVISLQGAHEIQIMEGKIRKQILSGGHVAKNTLKSIIGGSEALRQAKKMAFTYASVDGTVLITGETGTGKELFAQSIHNASPRQKEPFVAVNCAALPEALLESELFGYERGAFTGARSGGKSGFFEIAHGGTIFLDEIGELPVALQARLLRVLQEKEIVRVGGEKVIPIDVRVLAATNRNLLDEVAKGNFRADLYYRLSVLVLQIPPLRARGGDIRELAEYFIGQFSNKYTRGIRSIREDALALLESMSFPGNVRELANLAERAVVLCQSADLCAEDIRSALVGDPKTPPESSAVPACLPQLREADRLLLLPAEEQRRRITHAFEEAGGSQQLAAEILGISRTTLWRKRKELRL
ncbi:sigma-54-dependent Fis family transcriptional regulator [Eubacteriales bacterium]|nr:sigma 54-interacting transcriptional regulator [Faecalicatena sp. BF-R-105]GKH50120.1 sigma-54-dependent Fis family transcriptional regulator [Eubacteriales bacterium]GKH62756.1 sigma-54-dependent Fis family transcriptional regulator [Eubacteriales bacterium]